MKHLKTHTLFFILLFLVFLPSNAQTVVNSLSELTEYLDDDNVNVKLAPGTYTVTADNAADYGQYEDHYRSVYTLFLFSGNNSTYDFTDAIINVETEVLRSFGNVDVYEIRTDGNNNVLKNLTLTDVGSVYDAPSKGANNIVMDGQNNIIDGFNVSTKGSSPYGYGDMFGKGSSDAVVALKKHCGVLMRGDYNTLKNTTLLHKAFGHCVFFQAANHPTVDGCHIEGEVRSTDDILAEEGTGSVADDLDFMTVWDYKLPSGFMIALCEGGIRSYDAGETFINGKSSSRGTNDVTVMNTVVKHTRTACTLSHGSGNRHVENVTSIGNEFGFAIGNGELINCYGDAAFGPVYHGDGGVDASVTLIAPENGYYNGSKSIATTSGGTFNLYVATTDVPSDLLIELGTHRSYRHQEGSNLLYQVTTDFSGATLYNHSDIGIDIGSGVSNCNISTCGAVVNKGSRNTINYWDDCESVVVNTCSKSASLTQAECYDDSLGIQVVNGSVVGYIENGDWVSYNGLDLTDMNSVDVTYASQTVGGAVEFRLDAVDGVVIGGMRLEGTGAWDIWGTATMNIDRVEGVHDLFLVFTGGDDYLFDLDKFSFSEEVYCNNMVEHIEAECFDDMFEIQNETCDEGGENIGYIQNGDWAMYSGIDLTGMKSMNVRVACNFDGGTIEVRQGSESGTIIGLIPVQYTGGNQEWVTLSSNINDFTGLTDVYLVFTGADGYLYNINNFGFSEDAVVVTGIDDATILDPNPYPNPVLSTLYLDNILGSSVQIYNAFGKLVLTQQQPIDENKIAVNHLSSGIYFINILKGSEVITKSFIKK